MPEGPEIRRAADKVAAAIEGRVAEEVFFAFDDLKSFERELAGRRVTEVATRGKAMLTWFEGDYVVYSHNQLYGRWYTRRRGSLPNTTRQLRFGVHSATHSALLYSASEIDVLPADQLGRHPFLARLGPDALDPATKPGMIRDRLGSRRFARRQVGALLLDQGFVAGLGNYLRAEIAFAAGRSSPGAPDRPRARAPHGPGPCGLDDHASRLPHRGHHQSRGARPAPTSRGARPAPPPSCGLRARRASVLDVRGLRSSRTASAADAPSTAHAARPERLSIATFLQRGLQSLCKTPGAGGTRRVGWASLLRP